MQLSSSAFSDGEPVPRRYTGDGEDISPPLAWSGLPEGTAALALICEDPDAPRPDPWVHWLIYDFAPEAGELPEGVPGKPDLTDPFKGRQGLNTFEKIGYGGPAPPRGHGTHHYIFTLYALPKPLGLPAGAGKQELLKAINGGCLATARLTGAYERK